MSAARRAGHVTQQHVRVGLVKPGGVATELGSHDKPGQGEPKPSRMSAVRALATEGIQRGHMSLYARNVASTVGADPPGQPPCPGARPRPPNAAPY